MIMKKEMYTGFGLSALFVLSACGNTAGSGESAEDILIQSHTAMNEVESYVLNMDMMQEMNLEDMDEEAMAVRSTQVMEMTLDPVSFKQDISMNYEDMNMMGEMDDSEGKINYQSYYTENDGLFMEEPTTGQWMKFPNNYLDEFLAMSDMHLNPDEQIAFLEDYVTELSLEEDQDHYYITLITEELDMEELLHQLQGFEADMPGMGGMEELFGMMDLQKLDFSITIDKETYQQTSGSMSMVMAIDMMGQVMETKQTTEMTMSDFNSIDPISIPADVLENAEEVSEDEFTPDM